MAAWDPLHCRHQLCLINWETSWNQLKSCLKCFNKTWNCGAKCLSEGWDSVLLVAGGQRESCSRHAGYKITEFHSPALLRFFVIINGTHFNELLLLLLHPLHCAFKSFCQDILMYIYLMYNWQEEEWNQILNSFCEFQFLISSQFWLTLFTLNWT